LSSALPAVVFDCDGLLVETESRWTIAEEELFARYGRTFNVAHKEAILGKSMGVAGVALEPMLDQPGRGLEIWDELVDLVEPLMHEAQPMPGAHELVAALDAALRAAGLDFEVTICGDEVAHPKPAPDLYARACELLGVAPADAVALEDSATGVASAHAAGLFVIAVPTFPLEADLVADSLLAPPIWTKLGIKSGPPAAD
jgi:beta-phosphoglucomutase-like phosphatase (HAD superfamily)